MGYALRIAWHERGIGYRVANLVVAATASLAALGLAYASPSASLIGPVLGVAVAGVAIWMMSSAKTHVTLAFLMLYLGLADGVIKLMTNSSYATLGRDALFYAIVVGILFRRALRKEKTVYPPLTGWIIAYLLVIFVQLFNPGDVSLTHSLASTRPHLEFVPLFFFGYSMMRTTLRLKGFLALLLLIAAANGVVSVVQVGITPSQFAKWGPGYAARIDGIGVSPREFEDSTGKARVRPFGLGDDIGFGGAVGSIAVPAMLALLSVGGSTRRRIIVGVLAVGVVLAVVTSEARIDILASVAAIIVYLILATSSRRALRVLCGLAVGSLVAYGAIAVLASGSNSHIFDKYSSITPTKLVSTTTNYRSNTWSEIPIYIVRYPLGAGIGHVGPAASSAGGNGNTTLDAESEPTYLLLELGIPGFVLLTAFQLRMLSLSGKIRRIKDIELRLLLAAFAAPLAVLLVVGLGGITTAVTPGSAYLWFASGILVYWLYGRHRDAADSTANAV